MQIRRAVDIYIEKESIVMSNCALGDHPNLETDRIISTLRAPKRRLHALRCYMHCDLNTRLYVLYLPAV